jgi:hypothetical protein
MVVFVSVARERQHIDLLCCGHAACMLPAPLNCTLKAAVTVETIVKLIHPSSDRDRQAGKMKAGRMKSDQCMTSNRSCDDSKVRTALVSTT